MNETCFLQKMYGHKSVELKNKFSGGHLESNGPANQDSQSDPLGVK